MAVIKVNPVARAMRTGTLLATLALTCHAASDAQQACARQYQPQSGQPGKDVVWMPTNDALTRRMLAMAAVKSSDLVYDLGAGDGKIAIAAARDFGARAVGVEYNPDLARLAQCLAKAAGVADRVRIVQGDIFETDFSDATVVMLYLLPELNLQLRPTILAMKPGTRVVSHSFLMDDWRPDERSSNEDGQAYMWIVPANVAGTWRFEPKRADGEAFTLDLDQTFQEVRGSNKNIAVTGRLSGDQLQLTFAPDAPISSLHGRIDKNTMDARVIRGGKALEYVGKRS